VVTRVSQPAARRLAALIASLWCLPATAEPTEGEEFRTPDLVELSRLDTSIHPDIRYATTNSFTGHKLYAEARAFLQRPVAEALLRAYRALKVRHLATGPCGAGGAESSAMGYDSGKRFMPDLNPHTDGQGSRYAPPAHALSVPHLSAICASRGTTRTRSSLRRIFSRFSSQRAEDSAP
jgi:hypothetical protein